MPSVIRITISSGFSVSSGRRVDVRAVAKALLEQHDVRHRRVDCLAQLAGRAGHSHLQPGQAALAQQPADEAPLRRIAIDDEHVELSRLIEHP